MTFDEEARTLDLRRGAAHLHVDFRTLDVHLAR
jgi:hypothetical protein